MKRKLLSLLAILMMALTAQAATRTVTWNASDIVPEHPWDDSFTKDGITMTADIIDFNDLNFAGPGSFTTASGKFTKIVVTAQNSVSGTGWSGSSTEKTWEGDASSSVSFNGDIMGMISIGYSITIVFTIEESVAVTGNSDGAATPSYWATYYNGTTSYTADANTTVYKAAMNGTSSLTLTEVADIPAGNAVILKSSSVSITLTPAASTTADLSDNVLKGGTTVTSGYDAYTLSRGSEGTGTVGFYKFNGASLDGSKAHLEIAQSAGARGFIGFGDDGTTAIEAPTATIIVEDGEIYDLTGRRIEGQPTRKGIYVKNGQKFIVK